MTVFKSCLQHFYKSRRKLILRKFATIIFVMISPLARASSGGPAMPWDNGLTVIMGALTGTTAHVLVVIAIAIAGLGVAFSHHGSGLQKGFAILTGGSVAVGAVTFAATLGITGAVM